MDSEELKQTGEQMAEHMRKLGDAARQLNDRMSAATRRTPQDMVTEFHVTYEQPVGESPQWLDTERGEFRWDLVAEEINEALDAYYKEHDLANFAKELADVIYVIYGFAVEMGIPLDAVLAEVHASNMSKLDADGKPIYRADGKVTKGPDYREPDIEALFRGTIE